MFAFVRICRVTPPIMLSEREPIVAQFIQVVNAAVKDFKKP